MTPETKDLFINPLIRLGANIIATGLATYLIYRIAQINAKTVVVRATVLFLFAVSFRGIVSAISFAYTRLHAGGPGASLAGVESGDLYTSVDLLALLAVIVYSWALLRPEARALRLLFNVKKSSPPEASKGRVDIGSGP